MLYQKEGNLYLVHGSCFLRGPLPDHPFFWIELLVVLHGRCGGTWSKAVTIYAALRVQVEVDYVSIKQRSASENQARHTAGGIGIGSVEEQESKGMSVWLGC